MNELINLGRNFSGEYELNYLSNDSKIYLMDNHLAAIWCWLQKINLNESYSFMHIDAHCDLKVNDLNLWIKEIRSQGIDFQKIHPNQLTKFQYFSVFNKQLLTWDNYLPIFIKLFPKVIREIYFAVHETGSCSPNVPVNNISINYIDIIDLLHNLKSYINDKTTKWIVNIDLDYFFEELDASVGLYQILTDKYAGQIATQIAQNINNIEVLTIAFSPENCKGWNESIRIAKIFTKALNLNF